MDPVTAFALQVALAGAFLYGLYWVVRKAVAAGRIDARRQLEQDANAPQAAAQTRHH